MSERIDHVKEAQKALSGSGDGRNVATDASANAQAHAILALVEQQRIANLIALATSDLQAAGDEALEALTLGSEHKWRMRPHIAESLGITRQEHT